MSLNPGGHEVHQLGGKPIFWKNPPKANARCQWSKRTTGGKMVTGSFRHIAHLNRLNNQSVNRFKTGIAVIQPAYNSTVAASAGTHDYDACADIYIPGVEWWKAQGFFRARGFGCWYRHPPTFSLSHIHGFTIPPASGKVRADDYRDGGFTVGLYVDGGVSRYGSLRSSSQLVDYYNHAFGLSGMHSPGSDRSWYPKSITATIFSLGDYIKKRA
jgi:hypothetical protein